MYKHGIRRIRQGHGPVEIVHETEILLISVVRKPVVIQRRQIPAYRRIRLRIVLDHYHVERDLSFLGQCRGHGVLQRFQTLVRRNNYGKTGSLDIDSTFYQFHSRLRQTVQVIFLIQARFCIDFHNEETD